MKPAALVLAVAACAAAPHAATTPLPATELRLANGMRVVLAPDPGVASVVVLVRAPAGTADGDAAELIARALDTLDAPLEELGGWSVVQLARDHTSFVLEVPGEALARAVFLEAERFMHASVADAVTRAPALAAERADRAGTRAGLIAAPAAPATPAGIAALLRARFAPAALIVVVTGGFAVAEARRVVAAYFGALPAGGASPRAAPASPVGAVLHDRLRERVTVAFAVPEPFGEDRDALDVAARVLRARLVGRLGADAAMHVDPPFAIEGPAGAQGAILAELARLRDTPIADAELARAIGAVALEQVTALEDLAYRAAALAELVARGARTQVLVSPRVLTAASVQAAARTWLAAERAIVVVGDAP